jgi:hypothetical protein
LYLVGQTPSAMNVLLQLWSFRSYNRRHFERSNWRDRISLSASMVAVVFAARLRILFAFPSIGWLIRAEHLEAVTVVGRTVV